MSFTTFTVDTEPNPTSVDYRTENIISHSVLPSQFSVLQFREGARKYTGKHRNEEDSSPEFSRGQIKTDLTNPVQSIFSCPEIKPTVHYSLYLFFKLHATKSCSFFFMLAAFRSSRIKICQLTLRRNLYFII